MHLRTRHRALLLAAALFLGGAACGIKGPPRPPQPPPPASPETQPPETAPRGPLEPSGVGLPPDAGP
jgi:predicted small lipoprotein YifL